jgi:hypothetical protein
MWYSILEYFKGNGEDEVVFVTNDGGFTKHIDTLQFEFNEFTDKKIEIHENSYYKDLIKRPNQQPDELPPHPLPDVNVLREKISETIGALCGFEGHYEDYNNRYEQWYDAFILRAKISASDAETVFCGLRKVIESNLFEVGVPANTVFEWGDIIVNSRSISMNALQEALTLYEEIRDKMSDYLPQFYSTAANIINKQYREQPKALSFDDDDEIPF